MDTRFNRKHFDEDPLAKGLPSELAKVLGERLRGANDRPREIDAIVRDLRKLGHDIYSWDDDGTKIEPMIGPARILGSRRADS